MDITLTAAIAGCAASLLMAGIIWFVQVVHYPLFRLIGKKEFADYEKRHARLTAFVVAPIMVVELAAASTLPFLGPAPGLNGLAWLGAVLVLLVWAVTFTVQVPLHRRLAAGYEIRTIDRLVAGNFARTILWSARAVVGLVLLVRLLA